MTILAPDVLIPNSGPLPYGWIVDQRRPSLIIDTNTRGCMLAILGGSAELRQVDAYGQVVGSETALVPNTPVPLAAGGRYRVTFDGSSGEAAPLAFS